MNLLSARNVTKVFPGKSGASIKAVTDVSIDVATGEVLGLVGESGCGKSTLGRTLLRLIEPSSGAITFDGQDLTAMNKAGMKKIRRDMQIVFQDPFGSLNPTHKVGHVIAEPLIVQGVGDKATRRARVAELIELVGLPEDAAGRYPHEFSGGQRQRIAIARALALDPKLIVADEAVSALDVSIQSQIINLIADLRARLNLAIVFISHDLSVIRHVSDRIAVMYLGRVVEIGPAEQIMEIPQHPYTRALLSAIPRIGARREDRVRLTGEVPDPSDPPPGCAFHGRCPHVMDVCRSVLPPLGQPADGPPHHAVACHLDPVVSHD